MSLLGFIQKKNKKHFSESLYSSNYKSNEVESLLSLSLFGFWGHTVGKNRAPLVMPERIFSINRRSYFYNFQLPIPSVVRHGILRGIQIALRLVPDGLLHGGPPCSSFVWLNRGTSKRSAGDVDGDLSEPSVSIANEILARTFQC